MLCNPNNPDGGYLPRREVLRFMDELTDLDLVVVDESFIDFMDAEPDGSVARDATIRPNVVVLKSLGKNFGLHGIRFGYLVANPALARRMAAMLPKWNLNSLAETVVFMLRDHERGLPGQPGAAVPGPLPDGAGAVPRCPCCRSTRRRPTSCWSSWPTGSTAPSCATTCWPSTGCSSASAATSWA